MFRYNPQKLPANGWKSGFALDFHTLSSVYVGDNEYGHAQFDTTRSDIGEALYRLKYEQDRSVLDGIVETAMDFLTSRNWKLDLMVPMPPSNPAREIQPVMEIAERLSTGLGLPLCKGCLIKIKDTPELKGVFDSDKRSHILKDAFRVSRSLIKAKRILLFDDLYRSGATARSATASLLGGGKACEVRLLALTWTRRNR